MRDVLDELKLIVETFGDDGSVPVDHTTLDAAIAEITRLRGDPSKDKSFGRFDRVTPILAADKDNGLIRITIGSREDGPFVVKRDQVLEVRWADGQVELVRRART